MSIRRRLLDEFLVNESADGSLLLRPTSGSGRSMLLVLGVATAHQRDVMEHDPMLVATVDAAIKAARGRERYLIPENGLITPSTVSEEVCRDDDPKCATPAGGLWQPYSP
jgi:hypothetical protein